MLVSRQCQGVCTCTACGVFCVRLFGFTVFGRAKVLEKFRAQALEWNWISGSRPFLAMLVMLPLLLTLVVMTVVGKLYCCPAA